MHTDTIKYAFLATVLWFGVQAGAPALESGRVAESSQTTTLSHNVQTLMDAPGDLVGREVVFRARFAAVADLFKPINTGFAPNEHINFAVWPEKAVLWDVEERKTVLPTLYVEKANTTLAESLRDCGKYDMVELTGTVTGTFAGYPWILVSAIESVGGPEDRLTDTAISHMLTALESLRYSALFQACRQFELALEAGIPVDNRVAVYEKLAQASHLLNRLDMAEACLASALDIEPDNARLHLALADISLRVGDSAGALSHSETATALAGPTPEGYGMMAEAAAGAGDFSKAEDCLAAATEIIDNDHTAMAMLSVRKARVALRRNNPAAAGHYDAAVAALPDAAWLHHEIGLMHESQSIAANDPGLMDKALAAYTRAAELTGNSDPAVMHSLAECEYRKQKTAEIPSYHTVRGVLDSLYARTPEYPAARILEGRVLHAEGRPEEAEACYQTIASKVGNDADALLAMAEAYMDLQKYDNALAALDRARQVQPWNTRLQALAGPLVKTAEPLLAEQIRTSVEKLFVPIGVTVEEFEPGPGPSSLDTASVQVPYVVFDTSMDGIPMTERDLSSESRATGFAAASPGVVYELNGRFITVGRNDAVRASAGTLSVVNNDQAVTSAMSAPLPSRRFQKLPITEVRLDRASALPAATFGPWNVTAAEEEHADMEDTPLSSAIDGSKEAFASMKLWSAEPGIDRGLPPFSFDPDHSPVLIRKVRAPDAGGGNRPVRNANLYRRPGSRVPAEIIEKEAINPKPKPAPDMSIMAPPGDGAVRRAEVRLPSSAMGIGMASDYQPGKDTF